MELIVVEQSSLANEPKQSDESKENSDSRKCENVFKTGPTRYQSSALARPTLWYLLNASIHYLDFLFDILLCFEYFHLEEPKKSKFQITLLLMLLPNILITIASTVYSLFNGLLNFPIKYETTKDERILLFESKFKHICFFLITSCFNVQLIIGLSIWLFFSFKLLSPSSSSLNAVNKNDLIELEYVILLIHLFHVLFNSVPQFLVQSVYLLSSSHNESLFISNNKQLKLIQLLKSTMCLSRFSFLGIQLLKYFFLNEFSFKIHLSKVFIAGKFFSNIFTLMIRLSSLVYLYAIQPIAFYLLIGSRFLTNFLYTYQSIFLTDSTPTTPDRVRFSVVSVFWFVVLSLIRVNVHIDNFRLKSFLFAYNLAESLLIFFLIYGSLNNSVHRCVFILVLLGIVYCVNILNEYCLWKLCYGDKNPQVRDLFNKWIVKQQLTSQTHNSSSESHLDREKLFS